MASSELKHTGRREPGHLRGGEISRTKASAQSSGGNISGGKEGVNFGHGKRRKKR